MPRYAAAWIAWSGWSLTVVVTLVGFGVALHLGTGRVEPGGLVVALAAMGALGALVAARRPALTMGWLLLAFAFSLAVGTAGSNVVRYVATDGGIPNQAGRLALVLTEASWGVSLACLCLLLLLAPDGRLLSRRWRWAIACSGAATALWLAMGGLFLVRVDDLGTYQVETDLLSSGTDDAVVTFVWQMLIVPLEALALLGASASLLTRLRRAQGEERQQLKWIVAGCIPVIAVQPLYVRAASSQPWAAFQDLTAMVLLLSVASGFGFALLRHRLWEIDLVIRRSVVYGALWLGIGGVYLLAALSLGLAASARVPVWLAVVVTLSATVLFQPARRRLEALADRTVFGRRERPLTALNSFGEALGGAEQTADIARHLASAAMVAAPLSWIRVDVGAGGAVEFGRRRSDAAVRFPLARGAELLGTLECQPLAGASLKGDEHLLLAAMSAQAGVAISHTQLASRIVRAQEAERRRIERNIHDGAQQELVALVARLGLARTLNGSLDHSRFLTEVQGDVRSILANLRDLAQGVHPSVLADGGLAAAVEDRCSRLPIPVSLRIAPALRSRRFDEEVEGAAYFVVAEGLTNLLRHSGATRAAVGLETDGAKLTVRVSDNGCGIPPGASPRHGGLSGLADRLQAIGGTLTVTGTEGGGTSLVASLPVRLEVERAR